VTKMSRGKVTTYSFVKDYEKWKHVTKLSHDKNVTKHVTKLSPPSDKNVTTYNSKDTLLKDIKDSNADFISMLKTSPAYRHVDVEQELAKMDVWLNVNKGRKKTKRFVVNWLNKVEKPLESTKPKSVAL